MERIAVFRLKIVYINNIDEDLSYERKGFCMKRAAAVAMIIFGLLAFHAEAQMAMRWIGTEGWGQATPYERLFNQYNLQVITGSIYRIDTITPMTGMSMGIQLVIRTATREEVPVHLGPAWYIRHQDMNLSLNDNVEIRGARFSLKGKNVIAAFEVRTSSRVLLLRDEDNVPYWCGWRKRKV